MDGVSDWVLASQVAKSGGLGMIACAMSMPVDQIARYGTLTHSGYLLVSPLRLLELFMHMNFLVFVGVYPTTCRALASVP